jgi:hypothetical protein
VKQFKIEREGEEMMMVEATDKVDPIDFKNNVTMACS